MKNNTLPSILCLVLGSLGTLSCAPVNVAGNYVGIVTNSENGCAIANWNVGAMYRNVRFSVVPAMMTDVTATLDGPPGALLGSFTTNNETLRGSVTGNTFVVRRVGFAPLMRGNCAYTAAADVESTISGNVVTGQIVYHYNTNRMSDCAELLTCRSLQQYEFTRVQ